MDYLSIIERASDPLIVRTVPLQRIGLNARLAVHDLKQDWVYLADEKSLKAVDLAKLESQGLIEDSDVT